MSHRGHGGGIRDDIRAQALCDHLVEALHGLVRPAGLGQRLDQDGVRGLGERHALAAGAVGDPRHELVHAAVEGRQHGKGVDPAVELGWRWKGWRREGRRCESGWRHVQHHRRSARTGRFDGLVVQLQHALVPPELGVAHHQRVVREQIHAPVRAHGRREGLCVIHGAGQRARFDGRVDHGHVRLQPGRLHAIHHGQRLAVHSRLGARFHRRRENHLVRRDPFLRHAIQVHERLSVTFHLGARVQQRPIRVNVGV